MISKDMLGCTNALTKGTRENRLNIRRDMLERSVLNGLNEPLMEPQLLSDFFEEFTREVNKARIAARVSIEAAETEIRKIDRELDTLLDLILKGGAADRINAKMITLEQRKKDITTLLETAEAPPALLHPNMAKIYHEQIASLHEQLHNEDTRAKAAERPRGLVSRIDLVPERAELVIVLRGDLAAILAFASGKKNPDFPKER